MENYTQQHMTILEHINALTYTICNLESHINGNIGGWRRDGGGRVDYQKIGGGSGGGRYCRQRNSGKYCWTNGSCGHNGTNCRNKSDGHKNDATFQNKQGGSTKNCYLSTWRGDTVENIILNQLIIPNSVPPKPRQEASNATAFIDRGT